MISVKQIKTYALALPETEETTHFRLQDFKVNGESFVVLEKGNRHAVACVPVPYVQAMIRQNSKTFAQVTRFDDVVCLRVDLDLVTPERLHEIIIQSWRAKAPRQLVAAYDAQ